MQVREDDGLVVIRLHEGEDFFPTLLEALAHLPDAVTLKIVDG